MAWTCIHNLWVVLGQCAQCYPCEASEQKMGQKLKAKWKEIDHMTSKKVCPMSLKINVHDGQNKFEVNISQKIANFRPSICEDVNLAPTLNVHNSNGIKS